MQEVKNIFLPIWEKIQKPKIDPVKEQIELMSQITLFQNIPKQSLKLIRSRCHTRFFKKGEMVFREGEPGIGMYIILEGKIEIFKEKENRKTTLSLLEKGDFFGEISLLLADRPRSASAMALEASTLLGFFHPDLKVLMKRNPHISNLFLYNIASILSERLIKTNEVLEKNLKL